jgi:hypothetical protein
MSVKDIFEKTHKEHLERHIGTLYSSMEYYEEKGHAGFYTNAPEIKETEELFASIEKKMDEIYDIYEKIDEIAQLNFEN